MVSYVKPLLCTLCALVMLLLGTSLGFSQDSPDIHFYLEDEPIYTSSNSSAPGLFNELMGELVKELQITPKVSYLPWKRAQLLTTKTPNAVIFPLSRTQERESKYLWLVKVIDIPVGFVSLDGRLEIDTVGDVKDVRGVGVITGTPQEKYLIDQNIPHIAMSGDTIYPQLIAGKIKVVLSSQPEAKFALTQLGHEGPVFYGKQLFSLPLWAAASPGSDRINAKHWRDAYKRLERSPRYEAILSRYLGDGLLKGFSGVD